MQVNKTKPKKLGGVFFLCLILGLALFVGLQSPKSTNAFSPYQYGYASSASPTSTSTSGSISNPALNDYLVVTVSSQSATTITSVTDTLGNTFTDAKQDVNTYGASIWIAKQTHTTGTDTAIAHFTGTANNITISIIDMIQIISTTPTVNSSGHGTTANPISVSSITPNISDACFSSGIVLGTNNQPTMIAGIASATPMSLFFSQSLAASAAKSFVQFGNYPIASTATTDSTQIININGGGSVTLKDWELVFACFPQSQVTTTTTTTTTTPTTTTTTTTNTTTTNTNTTTTITHTVTSTSYSPTVTSTSYSPTVTLTKTSYTTSTNFSTVTGTVIPEPKGSTDIFVILFALIVAGLMFWVSYKSRHFSFGIVSCVILLLLDTNLILNNQIVYGQNIFVIPVWSIEIFALLIIMTSGFLVMNIRRHGL